MSLFDSASICITPNGVKEGKLYSIKPTDGSGDLSVTRATTATRVNSDGLIEVTPYNFVSNSNTCNQFDDINATLTNNATTSPSGLNNASRLMETTATSFDHYMSNYSFGSLSGSLTYSIYLKQNGRRYVQLATVTSQGVARPIFDLQDGVYINNVGSNTGITTAIENVGNGWYRCSVIHPSNTTNLDQVTLILQDSATYQSYTGDVTKGVFCYGAQINNGTSAKEYFPTTDRLDIPRLDYTNGTCPSILVEPQRTNLLTYSNDFANPVYYSQDSTITTNFAISPDGTQNANKITATATDPVILQNVYSGLGTTYTMSIYAKGVGSTIGKTCRFFLIRDAFLELKTFDFVLTSEWQRFTATFTFTTAPLTNVGYRVDLPNVAVSGDQVLVYGAQLEQGSYATSYIPTTSASVTRNADVISKTGISSLIGQTEGTIFIDFVLKNPLTDTNRIFSITESVWNSGGSIRIDLTSTEILAILVNDGLSGGYISYDTTVTQNTRYKIAVAYKTNDVQIYVNGVNAGNITTATIPSCSELYLNALGGGYNAPYEASNINTASLWKTRLTNAELAQLTTI